ncbi:MAG: hypothetical protein LKK46_06125 [Ancrocorticia sp.]|jgi:hypothetical protein|nr:hypothetical protein [Ancrocorticia sp.]
MSTKSSQLFRKFFGFSLIPIIGAMSPLLVLPFVSRIGGIDIWASVGVSQSIGTIGAVVVSSGWTVAGPARLALAEDSSEQARIYCRAFWSKSVILAPASILSCIIVAIILPDMSLTFPLLLTVAMVYSGYSVSWFGVGIGSPRITLNYGTLPKILASIFAIVPIITTRNVVWYPISLLVGTTIGLALLHLHLFSSILPPWITFGELQDTLRSSISPAIIDVASSAASMAPVPVVAAVTDSIRAAQFSSMDKVFRYALFSVTALSDTLQSWVLERNARFTKRISFALLLHVVLGLLGLSILLLAGSQVSSLLFGAEVAASASIALPYGFAFFAKSLSVSLIRNIVIPSNRAKTMALMNVTASILCSIVMVAIATQVASSNGSSVAWVYATYELLVFACATIITYQQARRGGMLP